MDLGSTYASVADDVIIAGVPGRDVHKLQYSLRERFGWGSWTAQSSGLRGVRVHRKEDDTVVLYQLSHVNSGIDLIAVDTSRDTDRPLTAGDVEAWEVPSNGKYHRLDHNMQLRLSHHFDQRNKQTCV